MACITYVEKKFRPAALRVIQQARDICADYAAQGYDLTLRQLYYQFVARDIIPNRQTEYSRLGSIINDARLAGLLDWDYIVDRTRNVRAISHWEKPGEVIEAAASSWATDRWSNQATRVEVWIEKDALVGVLDAVCPAEDVPYFSCRGYTSQSELWGAAQRVGAHIRNGQNVTIIHLGDHDPSGVDMTRDIRDRLLLFISKDNVHLLSQKLIEGCDEGRFDREKCVIKDTPEYEEVDAYLRDLQRDFGTLRVNRIALNMDQVQQYDPPPNPAKLTDSRAVGYIENYGDESWELDALEPNVLADLIREAIEEERDEFLWEAATEQQERDRELIQAAADRWDEVEALLEEAS